MKKTYVTNLNDLDQPLLDLFLQENEFQRALREKTIAEVEHSVMMSTSEQIQFLAFLIKLMNVKRAIEIGVFTGYGTLAIAQALPSDGVVIACDQNNEWPFIGKPFWEKAGVAHKIDLHIAPAIETLQALLDEGHAEQFDFIFVDADKIHYAEYNALGYQLLRAGGLIVFDNVLRVGDQHVVDRAVPATRSVMELLESLSNDPCYEATLIPLAQGMLLAKKA